MSTSRSQGTPDGPLAADLPAPPGSVAELRREIEQTRAHLGNTVDQLAAKADIKAQAKAKIKQLPRRLRRKIGRIRAQAKSRAGRMHDQRTTTVAASSAAKSAGASARQQFAKVANPQDIIAVIASQHERIKRLLERVQQETGLGRTEAFHKLRLTLALHETAEEQAIHPQALRQLGPYDRAATDRIAEEQTAGQTIGALEILGIDSDQFNYTFEHFASSVVEHATAEENDEWPALLQISEVTVVNKMVQQMQAVTRLVEDRAAPGFSATFEEMRQWARSRLPQPPESG